MTAGSASTPASVIRAAVIGHTGRGNYGHGLDVAAVGVPGVQLVAVADPDEAGRRRAQERTGAATAYAGYREMLEQERPDLVVVAPRVPDDREAMLLGAIGLGARAIYCEKPFAPTLAAADRVLAAAEARGTKIAVAHQNRAFRGPVAAQRLIAEGKIGRLRMMRGYGKQDQRGGGEEFVVIGTHLLDLMGLFAGQASWCHARVCADGRDAAPPDVHAAGEALGLVVGDDVTATYGFANGITGTYETARVDDGGANDYFRLELCGTAGIVTLWSSATAPIYLLERPYPVPQAASEWQRIELWAPDAAGMASDQHAANQLLVSDLVASIGTAREPISSGRNARAALEMVMAAFASHVAAARVTLPLAERSHPLLAWRDRSDTKMEKDR